MRRLVRFLLKKEILLYMVFGGLTTLVNLGVYFVLARVFGVDEVVSNCIAWAGSVVFAYVTNRIWVFESKASTRKEVLREATSFIGFRAVSGLLDMGLFALCVKVFLWNDAVVKIALQVIIVVFNYIASKLFVFRKK